MPIQNPADLAEEFKKSGEFDRLRRELLEEFRNSDGLAPFVARVEDIIRKKLHYDSKLLFGPEATAQRELTQELDRYPVVERAVSDIPSLADSEFTASLRESLSRVLQECRSRNTAAPEGAGVDSSTPTTSHPTLEPLQIPVLNGRTTPNSLEESQTRTVHFDAQQDQDNDWDSAMEESPVSEHNEIIAEVKPQVAGPEGLEVSHASEPAVEMSGWNR